MAIETIIGIGIIGALIILSILGRFIYGPNPYTEEEIERYVNDRYHVEIDSSSDEYEVIEKDGKRILRTKQKRVKDGNFVILDDHRRPRNFDCEEGAE